tara:strand:- start:629 stop:1186 length:558 start_codon:yes stop_codon:yes gene_type:complete
MVTTASLFQSILEAQKNTGELPPVEKWNPPLCENVDMKIARDGKWYFMNSLISREKMVNLFSSVIRFDDDGYYYLVTPHEKIKLEVEDKPFVITTYSKETVKGIDTYLFKTNVGEIVPLNDCHPMRIELSNTNEPSPYVLVRKNLEALLSRNVFYQLVEEAEMDYKKKELFLMSSNYRFSLGVFE